MPLPGNLYLLIGSTVAASLLGGFGGVLSVAANAYDELRYTVQSDGTITAVLDKALAV